MLSFRIMSAFLMSSVNFTQTLLSLATTHHWNLSWKIETLRNTGEILQALKTIDKEAIWKFENQFIFSQKADAQRRTTILCRTSPISDGVILKYCLVMSNDLVPRINSFIAVKCFDRWNQKTITDAGLALRKKCR